MANLTELSRKEDSVILLELLEPFKELLTDDEITEIAVNRPGQIYFEKRGRWIKKDAPELTFKTLKQIGVAAAVFSGANQEYSTSSPILSAVLPGGERAQFVLPPACQEGTISVTIRKPSFQVRSLDDYAHSGFFDCVRPLNSVNEEDLKLWELYSRIHDAEHGVQKKRSFIEACVKARKTLVIAGETGSGKTTFMKALMQSIPFEERIITIEDVPELVYGLPNHDNKVCLFYASEVKTGSTVKPNDLMRSCLRMKPDRILLAELRGSETYDFLNVCLSGHGGSITSCHAGSCKGVFEYLTLKVQQSEEAKTMTPERINTLLHLVIDVVIHVHNSRDKGRHITEIWFNDKYKPNSPKGLNLLGETR